MADETNTSPSTATTSIAAATAAFDKVTESLRGRVDLFGKALAAIATLGTGAVGLATISDLAPLSDSEEWAYAVLSTLFLLLAAGMAVIIASKLVSVGGPVVLGPETDPAELGGSSGDVARIFELSAKRFGFSSLVALQERERGLRKAALRATTDDERARRTALADEIRAEIDYAVARARTAVIRRKAASAISSGWSGVVIFLVAVGLVGFALFSDLATSGRTDAIDTAKACAAAREAGAMDAELDDTPCSKPKKESKKDEPKPTPGEVRVALASQLIKVLESCVAEQSVDGSLEAGECDVLRNALTDLVAE